MISLFKNGIKDKKICLTIEIEDLINRIKNNSKKDIITNLWALDYKCEEYNSIKCSLPYITPHGHFNKERKNDNLISLSNYIYFDIDANDILKNISDYKIDILNKYKTHISLLGKSVGGRGIFFYVKIKEGLTKDNFSNVFEFLRTEIFSDLKIDINATGISRSQFIPYDPDLYFNENVSISIPRHILYEFKNEKKYNNSLQKSKCINSYINNNSKECYTTTDTFDDFAVAYQSIIKETPIEFQGENVLIKEMEIAKLYIPVKDIKDGNKHKTYRAMIHNIMLLNPGINVLTIKSIINWVNECKTGGKKMKRKEMMRLIDFEYRKIIETGELHPVTRSKKVHTNPKASNRRELAAAANGKLKREASIHKIQCAIDVLVAKNEKVTQMNVLSLTEGYLSISTIKRHWKAVKLRTS